ncbi:VOC family protein [Pseudooceanicola sp. LIPI14-2-Ac024]|uniref:VOC family protein n=1 Tax=Pseudooceanicola sp. LIPI14-2-Ac024 TaxID=3344875 RepID=UPI0035CEFB20
MADKTSADWRYPYGSGARFHMHHAHLFASDIEATIDFFRRWFDAEVAHDGPYANSRNVFLKIGIGALHLYDQPPRELGRNAVHHLGFQVVGIDDLYQRMKEGGVDLPNPIKRSGGSAYFMVAAPDNVLLEVFEPGPDRPAEVNDYYGFNG